MTVAYHWHVLCNILHVWIPCDSFPCLTLSRIATACIRLTLFQHESHDDWMWYFLPHDVHSFPMRWRFTFDSFRFGWLTILMMYNPFLMQSHISMNIQSSMMYIDFPCYSIVWRFAWWTSFSHAIRLFDESHDVQSFSCNRIYIQLFQHDEYHPLIDNAMRSNCTVSTIIWIQHVLHWSFPIPRMMNHMSELSSIQMIDVNKCLTDVRHVSYIVSFDWQHSCRPLAQV